MKKIKWFYGSALVVGAIVAMFIIATKDNPPVGAVGQPTIKAIAAADTVECPPPTVLGSVQYLASEGILEWGTASVPGARFYWTHPTTGTKVVSYNMEIEIVSVTDDTARAFFIGLTEMDSLYGYGSFPYPTAGEQLRARVAGVDSLDRIGPASLYSDWFGDNGPPGIAGKPSVYLQMVK